MPPFLKIDGVKTRPLFFDIEHKMKLIDVLILTMPSIVGVLYFIVGLLYALKREWAWSVVWFSYAMANVGLILIG